MGIFVWVFALASYSDGKLHVYSFNIGQGDATFIETPKHTQVLIDGGPDASVLGQLSSVMPFYDRSIDLIVLTHPQLDHLFGLVEVLKRYSVGHVLMTGVEYKSRTYDEFNALIAAQHIPVWIARAGQRIALDDTATIDVLYPLESDQGMQTTPNDVNDTSVATLLTYGKEKFLMMGDAQIGEEVGLINSGQNINIDVLKLSHHGSKTSTSQLFLDKTTPSLAFASMGLNNRFGHPSPEVVQRLASSSIPFYRTDLQGRMDISTDGNTLSVKTER